MNSFLDKISMYFLFLLMTLVSLTIVNLRMKRIEQDYTFNNLNIKINKQKQIFKDLRAKKAFLLSNSNLNNLAEKFHLRAVRENQVIFIPE